MARLGKIIDGKISYAPSVYRSEHNVIHNFDKDYNLMIAMGYKPIAEETIDTKYKTIRYLEESDNAIIIKYKIDNSEKTIKQMKTEMIEKTKVNLSNYLNTHPLVSSAKGGVELEYSVSLDKQNQLTSAIANYISKALPYIVSNSLSEGQTLEEYMDTLPIPLLWNSKGDTCEQWKYSELNQLKNEIFDYVMPIVEHQRKLEKTISSCTTQEELTSINIEFTEDLFK